MTSRQKQRSSQLKTVGCLVHNFSYFRGFAKLNKFKKFKDNWEWVDGYRSHLDKKLENRPQKLFAFIHVVPACRFVLSLYVCYLVIML